MSSDSVKTLAYVNGDYVDLSEAKIDALDRGYIFGDGLYEVIAIENGIIYQLDDHLDRYRQGAEEMLFENYPQPGELKEICYNLLEKNKIEKGIIYLQITRATAQRTHSFPESPEPNVFMFIKELQDPTNEQKRNGVKTILVPDERWDRCHVKSINLMPNCFYKEKAKRNGAFEAIQVSQFGISEGTSTNVFGVKNNVIYTASIGPKVLSGITRKTVLQLAKEEGIEVLEKFLSKEELLNSDEVFITSTTLKLLPVRQIDEVSLPVSNYKVTFKLQQRLEEYILSQTS